MMSSRLSHRGGPSSPCSHPRCPRIAVRTGRCAEHNRAYERERGRRAR